MSDHEDEVKVNEVSDEDDVEAKEVVEKEEEEEVEEEEQEETGKMEEDKNKEDHTGDIVNEVKDDVKTKEEVQQKEEEKPVKETPATPTKEPDVPLYDQPLEMSGKRDRKKVERFVQETKKEEVNITGSGVALGDIPFIEAMISKMPIDELKVLHRVAYNRPGSGNEIKRNIRKFSGFPYSKDDKKYHSKLSTVERILMPEIKKMLMILGLERSGNKGEVVERLMSFMLEPQDMGKKPPAPPKKRKSPGRPRKRQEKKQNSASQEDSGSSRSDSEQTGSDQEEEEEMEEEVEEKPKKTPGRRSVGKKTPGKRAASSKKTTAAKRQKPTPDSDDSDSDDEPLAKKVKQPPSDAELKVMVKKILEGANLEEVTMKSVCRQVYDSYPDFDLTHKKVFIKETVKSIIS